MMLRNYLELCKHVFAEWLVANVGGIYSAALPMQPQKSTQSAASLDAIEPHRITPKNPAAEDTER